jgi:transmembrane sensor
MRTSEVAAPARPSRETVAEAAAWISHLHGPRRSPEVEAGFRRWLASSEECARAFEGVTEIWDMMPAVSAGEMPRIAVWDRPAPPRLWTRAAAITAICAALALGARWVWSDRDYATGIGEQRIVNLDDGTRVSLNSDTRMEVEYSSAQRRVVLREGEAFFEVTHNPRRPFVVVAGGHHVTALGTAFEVRYEPDCTTVMLVEGKVAVSPGNADTARRNEDSTAILAPGERLTFVKRSEPKRDRPRLDAVMAWRRGEVIFDDTVLADAVAEMNRYDRTSLVIDDPGIAALRVSGIYRSGDTSGFARLVGRMYDLNVVTEDGRIHLRR